MMHHEAEAELAEVPACFWGYYPLLPHLGALTYLLWGECRRAAVSPIVVAVGPVVDGVTPTICLERLVRRWQVSVLSATSLCFTLFSHSPHLKIIHRTQDTLLWENTQRAGSKWTQHTQEVEKSQDKTLGSKELTNFTPSTCSWPILGSRMVHWIFWSTFSPSCNSRSLYLMGYRIVSHTRKLKKKYFRMC